MTNQRLEAQASAAQIERGVGRKIGCSREAYFGGRRGVIRSPQNDCGKQRQRVRNPWRLANIGSRRRRNNRRGLGCAGRAARFGGRAEPGCGSLIVPAGRLLSLRAAVRQRAGAATGQRGNTGEHQADAEQPYCCNSMEHGSYNLARPVSLCTDRGKTRQEFDSSFQLSECLAEGQCLLGTVAFDRGWVCDSPVRRYGLPRPDRAGLTGRVVANRDDEIDGWRPGSCKLVPALTSKVLRGEIHALEHRGSSGRKSRITLRSSRPRRSTTL